MVENGYVNAPRGEKAKAEPLGVSPRRNGTYLFAGEYFTEEVRREIISRYGEDALYEGGLSVRTTLDPQLQLIARKALQNGLIKFDRLRGYRGPREKIDISATGARRSAKVKSLDDVPEWRLAVVLESSGGQASRSASSRREISGEIEAARETETGLAEDGMNWAMRHVSKGKRVKASSPEEVLKPGDVVFVEKAAEGEGAYDLRQARKSPAAWWRWTRTPAACWPWSAASPMRSRSSTARRRPCASRVRRSSRSSMRRRSTTATRRPR
jgi:penicillin-binding protein 1A